MNSQESKDNEAQEVSEDVSDKIYTIETEKIVIETELTKSKKENCLTDETSIKEKRKERPKHLNRRSSTRVVGKRRHEENKKNEDVKIEAKQPRPKKPKLVAEQSLQDLFLTDHLDTDKDCMFRSAEDVLVCTQCSEKFDEASVFCNGSCNKKFHKECFSELETDGENGIKYFCEECCKTETECCLCNKVLATDEKSNFVCKLANCNTSYHKKCLELVSKNSKTCLKHYCHTCYLKDSCKEGPIVSCTQCPLTYHADILCIPVSTKVISQTQIICPHHKPKEAYKSKQVNLNYCCFCALGGSIICCDTCPRSFHKECLSSEINENDPIFKCDVCVASVLPLYNSIVWAKLGSFRWWPAFVLIPWIVPLQTLSKQKSEWEFCIRFLGSHDFTYTTSEKVFTFDISDAVPNIKAKNALDDAFNKALKEAKELVAIFENIDLAELEKNEGKEIKASKGIYKAIQICRPIPPVKLKKSSPEPCCCKETDEAPCSRKSNCINVAILTECNELCPAGKKCQNQKIRNRENINLKIIKTKSRGYGAFVTEDIPESTFVIEYIGELINSDELNRRKKLKNKRNEKEFYFFNVENNLYIDAEFYSNKGRFINHSCDPNCTIRKMTVDGISRIGIYTNQSIKAGTELTFNYQMEFGKGFGIKCNCRAKSCTGVIGKFSKT